MADDKDKQKEAAERDKERSERREKLDKSINTEGTGAPRVGVEHQVSDPDPTSAMQPNAGDPIAESARVEGAELGVTVDAVTGQRLTPEDAKKLVEERNQRIADETKEAEKANK